MGDVFEEKGHFVHAWSILLVDSRSNINVYCGHRALHRKIVLKEVPQAPKTFCEDGAFALLIWWDRRVGTFSVLFLEALVDALCTTIKYTGVEAALCDPRRHGAAYASLD